MSKSAMAAEIRDAVTPRAFALVVGVLLLQLGFLLSYIGAFHHPTPHRLPLAVAGSPQVSEQLAQRLDALPGQPAKAVTVADADAARTRLLHREVDAAYLPGDGGGRDTLLVASAAGGPVTEAAQRLGRQLAEQRGRSLDVRDIAPADPQDRGSLTAFYLAIGWMIGGYLAAAALGVAAGAQPASPRRAGFRLAALVLYALVSGVGGALIVGPVLGALGGHFLALAALGALVVFGAGAATLALQALFGTVGVGLAVLVFVVLGNPSAGGAYQAPLLPGFWAAIGPWLPPGATTSAVRHLVYFDGNALGRPLLTLALWAVAGVAISLVASARHPINPDLSLPTRFRPGGESRRSDH
ncbi:DUF3533 domain-containing protein [Streptomyces sp. NPDC005438]|uniref:DUF3533 domain-containing protein n=1 Tax=Streptomyces sp. NPDC005438 TaxID=3156880 RepID=UPI0033A54547